MTWQKNTRITFLEWVLGISLGILVFLIFVLSMDIAPFSFDVWGV